MHFCAAKHEHERRAHVARQRCIIGAPHGIGEWLWQSNISSSHPDTIGAADTMVGAVRAGGLVVGRLVDAKRDRQLSHTTGNGNVDKQVDSFDPAKDGKVVMDERADVELGAIGGDSDRMANTFKAKARLLTVRIVRFGRRGSAPTHLILLGRMCDETEQTVKETSANRIAFFRRTLMKTRLVMKRSLLLMYRLCISFRIFQHVARQDKRIATIAN